MTTASPAGLCPDLRRGWEITPSTTGGRKRPNRSSAEGPRQTRKTSPAASSSRNFFRREPRAGERPHHWGTDRDCVQGLDGRQLSSNANPGPARPAYSVQMRRTSRPGAAEGWAELTTVPPIPCATHGGSLHSAHLPRVPPGIEAFRCKQRCRLDKSCGFGRLNGSGQGQGPSFHWRFIRALRARMSRTLLAAAVCFNGVKVRRDLLVLCRVWGNQHVIMNATVLPRENRALIESWLVAVNANPTCLCGRPRP